MPLKGRLYFQDNDDLFKAMDAGREEQFCHFQPCWLVSFEALRCDLLGFKSEEKETFMMLLSHCFISAYVVMNICFTIFPVFCCLHLLIFRGICAFMACMYSTVEFFQILQISVCFILVFFN